MNGAVAGLRQEQASMTISLLMFAIGSFIATSAIGLAATSAAHPVRETAKSSKVRAGGHEQAPPAMRECFGG